MPPAATKKKANPFTPGYGVYPPELAGRDRLQDDLRDRLDGIVEKKCNPTAIVLTGPRGCGKTSLLGWLRTKAMKRGLAIVSLASDTTTSPATMARQFPPKLWERLSGLQVNVGPTGVGGGVDLARSRPEVRDEDLRTWIEALGSGETGGVILIDEAHSMAPEVGTVFYNAAQAAAQDKPILLVIAGTPDLRAVLRRSKATFTERAQLARIGRLTRDESRRALTKPFAELGKALPPSIIEPVLNEAQDYPYFIQLWGKALWDVMERYPVLPESSYLLAKARELTRPSRQGLYGERMQELAENDLLIPVAEMACRLGANGKPGLEDFYRAVSHITTNDDDRLINEQRLLHTGFIWEKRFGEWDYGIPSLASHVREHAVERLLATLKEQNIVKALQSVVSCFPTGTRQNHITTTDKLRYSLADEPLGPDGLIKEFLAMKLLGPTRSPEIIRLLAPHLVNAILAQANKKGTRGMKTTSITLLLTLASIMLAVLLVAGFSGMHRELRLVILLGLSPIIALAIGIALVELFAEESPARMKKL